MKKILFVLHGIGIGGSMTSMINILKLLKLKGHSIDLLLMMNDGELSFKAKESANLLKRNIILEAITMSRQTIRANQNYIYFFIRAYFRIISILFGKNMGYIYAAKKYNDKYDCVVAYQESTATNFVHYIKADKKIAWIHNDYDNVSKIYPGNRLSVIYNEFNKIVCVSDAGKRNFIDKSNIDKNKFLRIYNAFDTEDIIAKSLEYEFINSKSNILNFVSIGRFVEQKQFDRVIYAAIKLKNENYEFKWYIIGGGVLFEEIKKSIANNLLSDYVILTGIKTNPFPIIKAADILVITSNFEAHPMIANEALILHKPVISTNYESACEVIKDGHNGLLCENSAEGVFNCVKRILDNRKLLNELKENVADFVYYNEDIIRSVIDLLS